LLVSIYYKLFSCVVLRFCLFVLRVLLWFVVSAFLSGFEDKVYFIFILVVFAFYYELFFIVVLFWFTLVNVLFWVMLILVRFVVVFA
jgi:hypothetical protein